MMAKCEEISKYSSHRGSTKPHAYKDASKDEEDHTMDGASHVPAGVFKKKERKPFQEHSPTIDFVRDEPVG